MCLEDMYQFKQQVIGTFALVSCNCSFNALNDSRKFGLLGGQDWIHFLTRD